MTNEKLAKLAIQARNNSYSPYSNFMVGAALLATSGKVYEGCNIENASYTPTVCAERTAFFKAVSEGEKNFVAIAVAGWHKEESPKNATTVAFPCGVCRQVMREFCEPLFKIFVVDKNGAFAEYTLEEIFPHSFGPQNL